MFQRWRKNNLFHKRLDDDAEIKTRDWTAMGYFIEEVNPSFAKPRVRDPDVHHGTCVTHVPWCMSGSRTSGFLWSRRWGKFSRHSRRMRNPRFYVFGKRPIHYHHCANFIWRHWTSKMPVRYNLSSVWVRLSIFSQLSIIQYVELCVFSLPISFVMIERICMLCLIVIIKSEV